MYLYSPRTQSSLNSRKLSWQGRFLITNPFFPLVPPDPLEIDFLNFFSFFLFFALLFFFSLGKYLPIVRKEGK